MNELFYENGHLSDEGIRQLIDGHLDELGRLEAAEHLAFCDECILRYTQLLTDDCLVEPPELLTQGIYKRIRDRARLIFFNKYVTMAVAASFAIVFWVGGVFHVNVSANQSSIADRLSASASSFSEKTTQLTSEISDGISQFFENLSFEGAFNHEKK